MQNENNQSAKKFWDKGYYIALILCVVAVGVSGYLFTTSLQPEETPAQASLAAPSTDATTAKPDKPVSATDPALPAAVTNLPTEPETPTETTAKPAVLTTVSPVEGAIAQTYSMDHLSYNATTKDWRTHDGVDFAAEVGTAVVAAADGVVEAVYDDDFLGKTVRVSHSGGYVTRYANLSEAVAVTVGQSVKAGDTLGTVGTTALLETGAEPHLHFAVFKNNVSVDPEKFLQ